MPRSGCGSDARARAQGDGQLLTERLLGRPGREAATVVHENPAGAQLRVASRDEQRALDLETGHVDVLVEHDRAAGFDVDPRSASRNCAVPAGHVRPAQRPVRKRLGGSGCGARSKKFEIAHRNGFRVALPLGVQWHCAERMTKGTTARQRVNRAGCIRKDELPCCAVFRTRLASCETPNGANASDAAAADPCTPLQRLQPPCRQIR